MNNQFNSYLQQQIIAANPAQRVVMLYDAAIRALQNARQAALDQRIQDRFNATQKATDIIAHLMDTLDKDKGGEIAVNLDRLYRHLMLRIVVINVKNDVAAADEVVGHLRQLREAWVTLAQQLGQTQPSEPADASAPQPIDATA